MDRFDGVVLLAGVCVLLVVVSGAVVSGRVTGFDYSGIPIERLLRGLGIQVNSVTNVRGNSTTVTQGISTGTQGNATTGGSKPNGITPPANSYANFFDFLPALPTWFLATIAVLCFGGACFLILRLKTSVQRVDLEGTLKEMGEQRKYLEETWSYRLRNAALLRYYILMRRACLKIGLRDELSETPQEYVGRVSSFLGVQRSEAARFASAVNRSRYGEELSEIEAGEASRFMGAFADVIRERANESP